MRPSASDPAVLIPPLWQICFCKREETHFIDRFLAPGFRHVFMLGFVPEADVWLFYDVGRDRTAVAVVSKERAGQMIQLAFDEGAVLQFEPREPKRQPKRQPIFSLWRLGFWCSRAVAHALGVRCVAATPKQLHDYLLKNGAVALRGSPENEPKRESGTESAGEARE